MARCLPAAAVEANARRVAGAIFDRGNQADFEEKHNREWRERALENRVRQVFGEAYDRPLRDQNLVRVAGSDEAGILREINARNRETYDQDFGWSFRGGGQEEVAGETTKAGASLSPAARAGPIYEYPRQPPISTGVTAEQILTWNPGRVPSSAADQAAILKAINAKNRRLADSGFWLGGAAR